MQSSTPSSRQAESCCITTGSGRTIDLFNINPEDIVIEDIAHPLSKLCRYGGHTQEFYSVAQHSVLVAALVRAWGGTNLEILQAILHDASEAYVVDLPSPLKKHIGEPYDRLENLAWRSIAQYFGIPSEIPEIVKRADIALRSVECEALMSYPVTGESPWWHSNQDWHLIPDYIQVLPERDHEEVATAYAQCLGEALEDYLKELQL